MNRVPLQGEEPDSRGLHGVTASRRQADSPPEKWLRVIRCSSSQPRRFGGDLGIFQFSLAFSTASARCSVFSLPEDTSYKPNKMNKMVKHVHLCRSNPAVGADFT
jgi:hypothetical protein